MKKLLTILFLVLLLLIACAAEETTDVEAEPVKPYDVYTEIDEDGCEYIVVYDIFHRGVSLDIIAKVNQPSECKGVKKDDTTNNE